MERKHFQYKKWICALLLIAVLFAAVWLLGRLTEPKYASGITEGALIGSYYAHSDSPHEVLFIGDCEVYEAYSPVTLFEEYGVTSFIRGTAQQLLWQSRSILEETLSYETPRVVVLSVCALRYGEPQSEAYNRMTVDGMRLSRYKLQAAREGMTEKETLLSYLFPLLRYHDRITELTGEDITYLFRRPEISFNGYLMHTETEPYSWLPSARGLAEPFSERARRELNRITELCKEKGITLILVKSPALYPAWYEEWDEAISAYASENGLAYWNANKFEEETGIDWSTDTMDGGMHLNVNGAEKLTRWFYSKALSGLSLTDYRKNDFVSTEYIILSERYNTAKKQ